MTHCWVTRQKYVGNFQHFKRLGGPPYYLLPLLPSQVSRLLSPDSRLPSFASCQSSLVLRLSSLTSCLLSLVSFSCLQSPVSCIPSLVSRLSFTFSYLPSSSSLPPLKLTSSRRGGRWPLGGGGRSWPPKEVENDHGVGKGEFDGQKVRTMTAGWRGGV